MKFWSAFERSGWCASVLVTIALLGCGSVDPGKNDPQAGSGGDSSSGGEGATGATGATGALAGEGGSGAAPEGGSGGSGAAPSLEALLPWAVGNTWTYEVTEGATVSEKTTVIEAEELVGGSGPNAEKMAFHVVTSKGTNGNDRTESWQGPDEDDAARIVRYREQAFSPATSMLEQEEHWDPEKLHIDGSAERTVTGASWLERYDETKLPVNLTPTTHPVSERWTVLADDVTLTVPAGTFENVIHFRKVGGTTTKEYWYARGVGKLRETGTQVEELVDYDVQEAAP